MLAPNCSPVWLRRLGQCKMTLNLGLCYSRLWFEDCVIESWMLLDDLRVREHL